MKKINITKITKNLLANFKAVGTTTDIINRFISPFGLFSKPKNAKGLTIDYDNYSIALHDHKNIPVNLKDNDVVLTDGSIYLHLSDKTTLVINATNIKLSGDFEINGDVKINGKLEVLGSTLTHNGINVSSTHTHGVIAHKTTTPPI